MEGLAHQMGSGLMCQFTDNIPVATDSSPCDRARVVQEVRHILKSCWARDVDCGCISKHVAKCTGACCNLVTKAVGVVMILGEGDSEGTAFAEPAAVTPSWELKLDAPLKSPSRATADYLPAILTGVLKNTGKWATTWLS